MASCLARQLAHITPPVKRGELTADGADLDCCEVDHCRLQKGMYWRKSMSRIAGQGWARLISPGKQSTVVSRGRSREQDSAYLARLPYPLLSYLPLASARDVHRPMCRIPM